MISSAYVRGPDWRTGKGLRVGSTIAELRGLYTRARPQPRAFRGWWPHPAWWVVHVRQRCVIGVCRSRYEIAARLTAHVRDSKIIGFFLPVGAQGE